MSECLNCLDQKASQRAARKLAREFGEENDHRVALWAHWIYKGLRGGESMRRIMKQLRLGLSVQRDVQAGR